MPPPNAAVGHHYTAVALNDESHGATDLDFAMEFAVTPELLTYLALLFLFDVRHGAL